MPERLFIFIQLEFPWVLGPPDGRYLLRGGVDGDPEHVIVLGTLAAGRARTGAAAARRRRPSRLERRRARGRVQATPEAEPVPTTRVTVIDPVPLAAEHQARAWLAELDRDRDVHAAVAVISRVLHLHRIAAADPYLHEVSPDQALVIRAGWGEGEQVADGRWLHARELPWTPHRRRAPGSRRRLIADRSSALRPLERLAALLSGRNATLMCEELALRARLDLDEGRLPLAALELDRAYAAGVLELHAEQRQDLALRIAELEQLGEGVAAQAQAALARAAPPAGDSTAARGSEPSPEPDEDVIRHALERLEAALRARTATGF